MELFSDRKWEKNGKSMTKIFLKSLEIFCCKSFSLLTVKQLFILSLFTNNLCSIEWSLIIFIPKLASIFFYKWLNNFDEKIYFYTILRFFIFYSHLQHNKYLQSICTVLGTRQPVNLLGFHCNNSP